MAEIPLTLALSQMERGQELWLPSLWGEGLGMRANHSSIQQRCYLNQISHHYLNIMVEMGKVDRFNNVTVGSILIAFSNIF
jgi:hypothetical protein